MITILNISDTKFSYNGIAYFKNFTPFVTGNKVSIVNTYDACISLTNFPTIYSDISVDGVTYGSVAALQNALLPVLFNRTFTQAGSLTAGYIPKATGINTLGNSAIYENSGKIGIGTTTTPYKFNVYDTSDGIVGHFSGGVSNYTLISFKSNEANVYSTSLGSYDSGMLFRTGATDRVYINSVGQVGINTTIPLTTLTVNGNLSLFTTNQIRLYNSAKNNWTEIASPLLGGDSEVDFRILTKTGTFYINASGNVGIGTTSPSNILDIFSSNPRLRVKDSSTGYSLLDLECGSGSFYVGNDNSTGSAFGGSAYAGTLYRAGAYPIAMWTNGSERMRITSSGEVLVNTTSSLADGVTMRTHISSDNFCLGLSTASGASKQPLRFVNGTTAVGSVTTTTTTTSYNMVSDYRLKKDYKTFKGLDKILQLKMYDFAWNSDESRMFGGIAHEIQEIVPQAVTGEKDAKEMQSVDYSKLVPILVQAIQELKAEIEILKN